MQVTAKKSGKPAARKERTAAPAETRPVAVPEPGGGTAGAGSEAFEDLTTLRIFTRVVELESFSEVARRMGVTPATVSKHIGALEARLRARLVNRTTRRLFITEAGQRLYERCLRVLQELEQAEAELSEMQSEPSGLLRVTAPLMIGARQISPRLPEFMQRYPKVSVDLNLSIRKVDLFQEHIDIAVRVAETIDPGLVAFRLAPYDRVFCASPGYLREHGTPRTPDDLARHNCLVSRGATLNASWPVRKDGKVAQVRVTGNLVADNGEVIRDAVLAGMGVCMTARWLVAEDLRAGRLVEVLPEYAVQNRAVFAVLAQRGAMTPKLRCFIDFLKECLGDAPPAESRSRAISS